MQYVRYDLRIGMKGLSHKYLILDLVNSQKTWNSSMIFSIMVITSRAFVKKFRTLFFCRGDTHVLSSSQYDMRLCVLSKKYGGDEDFKEEIASALTFNRMSYVVLCIFSFQYNTYVSIYIMLQWSINWYKRAAQVYLRLT